MKLIYENYFMYIKDFKNERIHAILFTHFQKKNLFFTFIIKDSSIFQ